MCSPISLGLREEQKAFNRTPKLLTYSNTYLWHTSLKSSCHIPVATNATVFQYEYKFQVSSPLLPRSQVLWDIAPCQLVNGYRRFEEWQCLHFRLLDSEYEGTTAHRNDGTNTSRHGVKAHGYRNLHLDTAN
jgi:hypothetical protein